MARRRERGRRLHLLKTRYTYYQKCHLFTKLKFDDNPAHQQSCSEQEEGREPPDTQQLTSESDHLADAACKLTSCAGSISVVKISRDANIGSRKIDKFESSQYEPGHLSQADACNIQDIKTATDQMLPSVEQRDETGVPVENSFSMPESDPILGDFR
jgi:hypothetical protein